MSVVFNSRVANLAPAASIALMEKARGLKAQGVDVISLATGEPDFDTPDAAAQAGIAGILAGQTHYVNGRGIPALRQRLSRKLREENGLDYSPDEILVTPGAKYAIFATLFTLLSPGDEVIVMNPCWVSYGALTELAGGVPVYVDLSEEDGYAITRERLEPHITDRTRLLILNTPNNPTGRVLNDAEAEVLCQLALEHDFFILSDEIYEKILFDGRKHISIGALPGMRERVITINGLSKCAAMTGWRVGYLAAERAIADQIYMFYQHTMTCIAEFAQNAALEALEHPETFAAMTADYLARRDMWQERMRRIPAVRCLEAEGTFYGWMRIDKDGMSAPEVANWILEQAQVVVVPGNAYGQKDLPYVRVSLATAPEELNRAADRLEALLNGERSN